MSSLSAGFSLVKYDTPILISKSFGKGKPSAASSVNTSASSAKSKDDPSSRTEDYLNSILPPREYSESG
jgi:dynein light intermediate chain